MSSSAVERAARPSGAGGVVGAGAAEAMAG